MSTKVNYPRPFGIRQVVTAGSQFGGIVTGKVAVFGDDCLVYPTSTVGGLFDPHSDIEYQDRGGEILRCLEFFLTMDGVQASWSIVKVDADGHEVVILDESSQAAATSVILADSDKIRLLPAETMKVYTAGCAAEIVAQGIFAPEGV